jgi:hypothetical protein
MGSNRTANSSTVSAIPNAAMAMIVSRESYVATTTAAAATATVLCEVVVTTNSTER